MSRHHQSIFRQRARKHVRNYRLFFFFPLPIFCTWKPQGLNVNSWNAKKRKGKKKSRHTYTRADRSRWIYKHREMLTRALQMYITRICNCHSDSSVVLFTLSIFFFFYNYFCIALTSHVIFINCVLCFSFTWTRHIRANLVSCKGDYSPLVHIFIRKEERKKKKRGKIKEKSSGINEMDTQARNFVIKNYYV